MHRKIAAAIVAVLVLAVAGCGGSEKTTLGRAALVRRVELACQEGQRVMERAARAARSSEGFNFDAMIAGQEAVLDKLDELDTSGAAKADFDALQEGMKGRLEALQEVASADRADRARAMRSVQADATAAGTRIETAVRSLGLQGCG